MPLFGVSLRCFVTDDQQCGGRQILVQGEFLYHPLRGQYMTKMVPRYRSAAWSIMWVVTIHNSGIDDLDPLGLKITRSGSGKPGIQNRPYQLRRNNTALILKYREPIMDQNITKAG